MDPIEVRLADGMPSAFLWRGRLYVVKGVEPNEPGSFWVRAAPASSTTTPWQYLLVTADGVWWIDTLSLRP